MSPAADSLENLLAEDATAASLPASAQPLRLVVASPRPLSAKPRSRRASRNGALEATGLVLLVLGAQFLIGLPLAYMACSSALTASFESEGECLMLLFVAAFGVLLFLAGVFNWTWAFRFGKIGKIMRDLGPFAARMTCLGVGGVLTIGLIVGTSNSRTFSERMWPLNGPIIEAQETKLPDHIPKPKSGDDAFRVPGRRTHGF